MATLWQAVAGYQDLALIRQRVAQAAAAVLDADRVDDLVLAVNEIVTNSIEHGYTNQPGWIEIDGAVEGDAFVVRVRDRAPLFDPRHVPPPDTTLPLHRRPPGGMGIHMTRHLVDRMDYRVTAGGYNETIVITSLVQTPAEEQHHADDD